MFYTTFTTDWCDMIIVGDENGITHLYLNNPERKRTFELNPVWEQNIEFFNNAIHQINEYISGERIKFDLLLNPQGTEYQKKVWQELCQIPYGEQISYKQLAERTGNSKASRAVGLCNSKNPIPLIIPCHRVIGSNGKLTGFAFGVEMKEKMIQHENQYK